MVLIYITNVIFEGHTPANYNLEVVNEAGNDILRLSIVNALGVDDENLTTSTLKVVPNPSQDSFLLQTKSTINKIQMFDVLGREVTNKLHVTPVTNGYQFASEQLATGVYVLKADNNSVRVIIK